MEWTSYHRLNDIYDYLDFLANSYPDVCSVKTIGNSIEGRPLRVTFTFLHLRFDLVNLILI